MLQVVHGHCVSVATDIRVLLANAGDLASNSEVDDVRSEWLDLPASQAEIDDVLREIECMSDEGEMVAEAVCCDFYTDSGLELARVFGDRPDLGVINDFARGWEGLSGKDKEKVVDIALALKVDDLPNLKALIDRIDEYEWFKAFDHEDLAIQVVEDHLCPMFTSVPDEIMRYFDYRKFGRDLLFEYTKTRLGYYKAA